MSAVSLFSAKVNAGDGFDSPAPLADIPGWTVDKQSQTEIYVINHNLNLSSPDRDLHVVVTPMTPLCTAVVESLDANSFRVSTWTLGEAPTQTDFMFIAMLSG
ncbi:MULTISPECIES: hypothetical protein [Marinobacter]|uniref:Uncharacterized protein n=1 Tax=Marinobacter suaedae TaxID=3057675 RepID=A0ABT8VX68_9GAMM|nr:MULTISPECIES: hypothetical protein [unclassified Marinobacter]MBZ2168712.1 hypothetical protein [Marinobacter sp. F4216]MDO3720590.1 hypothetical protein [Marinobacter sp. chi1]